MKKLTLFMLIAAMFMASKARAFDGETLRGACNDVIKYQQNKSDKSVSRLNVGICYGFISGVINNHKVMYKYRKVQKLFCTPENQSNAEIAKIYVKYLDAHPENLQMNGALLLDAALKDAYPCPKQLKPIR
jgi:hypothetical protein